MMYHMYSRTMMTTPTVVIERRNQKTASLVASAQAKHIAIFDAIKTHGAKSEQESDFKEWSI